MKIRIIYTDGEHLNRVDSVKSNPGKVFAVVGPFDNHNDKVDLQNLLETLLRGYNQTLARR
jgi:hypothetical protein